jgi:hypothetical protein
VAASTNKTATAAAAATASSHNSLIDNIIKKRYGVKKKHHALGSGLGDQLNGLTHEKITIRFFYKYTSFHMYFIKIYSCRLYCGRQKVNTVWMARGIFLVVRLQIGEFPFIIFKIKPTL